MATIGGGSYVHGHASGIDMELYGQGHVLGVEAGKGVYVSEIHQNYNRLFAGHNTVISNGASASKGGWIDLAINRVEKVNMEPEPRTKPISDKYSFVTASFYDEHNLVKEADHQRTTAVIRLSENKGYYLDVFRAKSDTKNQYDLPYYYLGHIMKTNFEYTSYSKLETLGVKNGYQHLWKEAVGKPSADNTVFSWKNNNKFYTLTTVSNDSDELILGRMPSLTPTLRNSIVVWVRGWPAVGD